MALSFLWYLILSTPPTDRGAYFVMLALLCETKA
jgi:hypothetical protein